MHANIEATLVAMREREPLIVNGRLSRAGTMAGPVASYEPLDDASEAQLAAQFIDQLRNIITDAETAGRTVRIFHWADPERSRAHKYPAIDELLEGRAFDLHAWFNNHFLTCKGSSIKAVAPIFGFAWAVEEAGGAQSQDLALAPTAPSTERMKAEPAVENQRATGSCYDA